MVVTDREPFKLRKLADLTRKLTQVIGVQHEHSQVCEVADVGRNAIQVKVDARLSLGSQVKHLHFTAFVLCQCIRCGLLLSLILHIVVRLFVSLSRVFAEQNG